jgi:hypothetical protein
MENFSTDREPVSRNEHRSRPPIALSRDGDASGMRPRRPTPITASNLKPATRLMRSAVATALTTTMIATAGFGTLPENPLGQQFQEVIQRNIPAEFIAPLNQVLEHAGLETLPASQSLETIYQSDSPTFLNTVIQVTNGEMPETKDENFESFLLEDILSAVLPENSPTIENTATPTATATHSPTPSPTITASPTSSPTSTSTITPSQTSTATPSPSATFVFVTAIPSPTRTRQPTATFTPTPSETPTFFQPPPAPEGYIISNVSINGGGTNESVSPDTSFTVTYDFQVYSLDACPGCIVQLVTGLGTPGSHGGSCPFDGNPGIYPGTFGSESTTLIAPAASGTYDVYVVYFWQYSCVDAQQNYPNGVLSQIIGQITVSP